MFKQLIFKRIMEANIYIFAELLYFLNLKLATKLKIDCVVISHCAGLGHEFDNSTK